MWLRPLHNCRGSLILLCAVALAASDVHQRRWEYFYGQRVFPESRLPAGARLDAYRMLRRMQAPRAAGFSDSWTLIGARPAVLFGSYAVSGRVNAIAVDPRNNGHVYLGGANGGIWKTFDGGATWMPLTDDQPSLSTGAIAIDPSNPDTIYVGTGEENFNIDAYTGVGILKSIDGGMSWQHITGPFLQQRIAAMTVHPTDGNTILAASASGLYRSTDAGLTWASVLSGTAISVFFDPANPGTAWAGIGNVDGDALNGVYRSTDGGATWSRANGAAPNSLPSGSGVGRIEVVNSPAGQGTIFAAIANAYQKTSSSLNGVYRTTDAGQNWTRLNAPDFCAPQCWYDLALRPDPANASIVFAAGINLTRSLDGGNTWQRLPGEGAGGAPHSDHHALAFTADGARLYDGNDGGAWSTDAPGAGSILWNDLNGTLALTQYYPKLSIHPTDVSIGLGGTQDNGTLLYRGSLRWTQVIDGDGGSTAIDPSSPTVAFGAYIDISLFRTSELNFNDGIAVTQGLNRADRHRFIGVYTLDPSNPQRMYYGTYRLYRSDDSGGLWQPISGDLTNPPSASTSSSTYTISAIAVAPSDSNTIYTGSAGGAVFSSHDGGATWIDRSTTLPARAVTHLAVDPVDPATVYVTYSGFSKAAESVTGHIFQSNNFGASWTDISGNLPNLPVDDVVVDPDLGDTLYAATDLGVMVSSDAGATWAPLGTGLPNTAVTSLVLHRPTRTLRAGTHGRSAWDYKLPSSSFAPVISSLSPATVDAGTGDFTLTISGSNFGPGVHVWWNGADRTVTSATATTLQALIPGTDIQSVGRAAVIVFNPARSAGASLPANFIIGPAPSIAKGGLVNAASGTAAASPGALMSLFGSNFTGAFSQAVDYPLPQTLGQVTLTIGSFVAPLYYVAPGQINFQVPFELASSGAVNVTVSQGQQTSATVALPLSRVSPALFSTNQRGSGQGAIRIAGQATIPAPAGAFPDSRPVRAGESIEIYCTGLGAVSPPGVTGDAASGTTLSRTLLQPAVTVGGLPAQVTFSGLAPGVAGLYQVNATIPAGVTSSSAAPVSLTIGGVTSNTVTVAVE